MKQIKQNETKAKTIIKLKIKINDNKTHKIQ